MDEAPGRAGLSADGLCKGEGPQGSPADLVYWVADFPDIFLQSSLLYSDI